ncbi:hypothetical protein [Terricaulis sp.]|uniref:hypothetical protein n=1 Tax=Terricaulis sp. TaxID=2768686 RepID=UPI003784A0BE
MRARLFVISTIGAPKSDRRRQADGVLENIIKPAAKLAEQQLRAGGDDVAVEVVRGDHDPDSKRIGKKIIDSIMGNELIALVAFEPNENVFYEAGIGHAAGRALLILRHVKYTMPIDVRDYPYVDYTDNDWKNAKRAARKDGPVEQYAAMIRLQLSKPRYEAPFEQADICALGSTAVLGKFRDLSYLDWSKMILDARKELWFAGISLWQVIDPEVTSFYIPDANGDWPEKSNSNLINLVGNVLARGADVNIMMMHPDNPALSAMLLKPAGYVGDGPAERLASVREQIQRAHKEWTNRRAQLMSGEGMARFGTDRAAGKFNIIQVRTGLIAQRTTWTERATVTSPYFASIPYSGGGPAFRSKEGQAYHAAIGQELRDLRDANTGAAEQAPGVAAAD